MDILVRNNVWVTHQPRSNMNNAVGVSPVEKMLDKGIYVVGFFFPVVPKGKARIRTQMSAAHTKQDLDKAIQAFAEVGKELHVI